MLHTNGRGGSIQRLLKNCIGPAYNGRKLFKVCCVVAIDFMSHSYITFKLMKEHNRVEDTNSKNDIKSKKIETTNLILAELVEGFLPLIYAICMAMAHYGPNDKLFANIGNRFWGEPIEDVDNVFRVMGILYTVDTISAVINSLLLWKVTKINMIQEFCRVLSKYWLFIVTKLSYIMASYFASLDVNFGLDSSSRFEWITPKGRLNLIRNSTDISDEFI